MPSLPPKDINVNKTFSKAVGDMRGLSINKTSTRLKKPSCVPLRSQLYSPPTKLVSDDDVIIESSKLRNSTIVYEAPTFNNITNDYQLNHTKTMIFEKSAAIAANNYIDNKNNIIATAACLNVGINDAIKQQPSISATLTAAKIPQSKNAELDKSIYWNNLAVGQIDDNGLNYNGNNNIYDLRQNSLHHPDNLYYPHPSLPLSALNHLSTNNTFGTAAFSDGANFDISYEDKLNSTKDAVPHKNSSIYTTFYNTDINHVNKDNNRYLFNPLTLSIDEVSPDLTSGSETSSLGSSPPKDDDDYRRSLLFSTSNNDKNSISSIAANAKNFIPFDEYINIDTTTFVSVLSKNEATNTNVDPSKSPSIDFDPTLCTLHKENTKYELDDDQKISTDNEKDEFRKSLLLSALNSRDAFLPYSSSNNSTSSPSHDDNSLSPTNKAINKESSDFLFSDSTTQNHLLSPKSSREDLHLLSQKYNVNNHGDEYGFPNSASQFKDNNIYTASKRVPLNKPTVNQKVIENLSNISTAVALANIKSPTTTSVFDDTLSPNTVNPKIRRNSDPVKSMSSVASSVTDDKDQKKTTLYKTEICRNWEEKGVCRYGNKCQFAHSQTELRYVNRHPRYKTEVCNTYIEKGICPYGRRCCFIHEIQKVSSEDNNNSNNSSNSIGNSRKSTSIANKQRLSKFISDPSIYGSYNNGSTSTNTNTAVTGSNEVEGNISHPTTKERMAYFQRIAA